MEIFAAQGALPLTLAANQPPVSLIVTGLIDTSGKLAKVAVQLFFKILGSIRNRKSANFLDM